MEGNEGDENDENETVDGEREENSENMNDELLGQNSNAFFSSSLTVLTDDSIHSEPAPS